MTKQSKCPVCGATEVMGAHSLCRKGEDTSYRLTEAQIKANKASRP